MTGAATNFHYAACLQAQEESAEAFIRESARRTLPAWRALADDGVIESRVVFEEIGRIREDMLPAWQFLSLARLAEGVTPDAFLHETARHNGTLEEPLATVRRAEFLRPTRNAYHPGPGRAAPVYSIEYIRVFDSHLDAYREMMETRTGPAVGALVDEEFAHDFLTFDTERVNRSSAGMPDWTAIHILGLDATSRWDAFPEAIDPHLRAIDPVSGFEQVFGPLPQIRAMERHVFARRIEELSIGY
jgi:hypothetical protein